MGMTRDELMARVPPEGEYIELDERDLVAIGKDAQRANSTAKGKARGRIEYDLYSAAARCAFAKFVTQMWGIKADWHGKLVLGCHVYGANGYTTSSMRLRPDLFQLGRTYILALTHKVVIPSPERPGAWELLPDAVILRGFLTGREIVALNDKKVVALDGERVKQRDEEGRVFYVRRLQVPLNTPEIISHLHWDAA
jgi:hypothetical protein